MTASFIRKSSLIAIVFCAMVLAIMLTGCSSSSDEEQRSEQVETNRTLVVYFSNSGNTEVVAEKIATITDADLFKIEPVEQYSAADLDYNDDSARCMIELNDSSARPAIANKVENWDSYSKVFIGYPIWWSRTPPIMQTFVESYDWEGKTVVPFCTSGSSPIGTSASVLEEETPGARWLEGQRFASNVTEASLREWVADLDI